MDTKNYPICHLTPSTMYLNKPPYLLWRRRQRWARPSVGPSPRTSPGTHPLLSQALLSCPACLMDRRLASSLYHAGPSQTPSSYLWVKTSVRAERSSKKACVCATLLIWTTLQKGKSLLPVLVTFHLSPLCFYRTGVDFLRFFNKLKKYGLLKKYMYKLQYFKVYLVFVYF